MTAAPPGYVPILEAVRRLRTTRAVIETLICQGLVRCWYASEADIAPAAVQVHGLLDHVTREHRERWRASRPPYRPDEPADPAQPRTDCAPGRADSNSATERCSASRAPRKPETAPQVLPALAESGEKSQ